MSVTQVIADFLQFQHLDFEANGNTFLVTLKGEKKLQTHCALVVGDHSLSINAFVIWSEKEKLLPLLLVKLSME